jgi:serine/threonine-protein kinase HipA
MATQSLSVWINGLRVGEWRVPPRAPMEFQYSREWLDSAAARPLSLSMPITLGDATVKGQPVECYFDNLLPDSDAVRKRLQTKFKAESIRAFDLLAAIGRDCVGAVQLLPGNDAPRKVRSIDAGPLSDNQLAHELARGLSTEPIGSLSDELRISIAGAQEKSAFLYHDGQWCKALGSTPTTHIFKLPIGLVGNIRADMTTSVENEWLCSRILAAYELPIASCRIGQFGAYKALIVERFDRVLHSSGKYWLRLVQEDMCQATATPHYRKYEADGGPGTVAIARILKNSTRREQDLITLFKSQLLFWMLAALDGHAKNFSIRILDNNRYQLTPLYDVLSMWPIIGDGGSQLSPHKARLAMTLPGKSKHCRINDIQLRHFELLGKQLGIGERVAAIIDETIDRTSAVIETVGAELPRKFPEPVSGKIFAGLKAAARALSAAKSK